MPIDERAKQTWQRSQSDAEYPVDAPRRPIDPSNEETHNAWREEGLDRFLYP